MSEADVPGDVLQRLLRALPDDLDRSRNQSLDDDLMARGHAHETAAVVRNAYHRLRSKANKPMAETPMRVM